ncbi:ATP-binding cassette domain-containing protein [Sphaerotilus sp.]|uniref:ABC transporter ATP-binding protein n=1 Tax=Sphaerotilus sp. TaxID=2093942 RepID=UPI0034E2FCCC
MTTTTPQILLQAERLTFHFPHRALFTGWSAQFGAGLSLVCGGDGSGKSTLLRLLAGVLAPQSGHLTLNGAELARHPDAYRTQVFWCDPADGALDSLGARDYLALRRHQHPAWDVAALEEDLDALGLWPHLDKPLYALSTGMRRKLRLAAGLASGAPLTLFDGPLAALDRRSADYVLDRLDDCADSTGRAVIVAHHAALDGVPLATLVDLPGDGSTSS